MSDINRPLRRLEVAKRIQDLRDKAAAAELAASELAASAQAAEAPVVEVIEVVAVEPSAGAATLADRVPDLPVPRAHTEHVVTRPTTGPVAFPDVDDSAAAAIASLLRRGETWLLSPDERNRPDAR